MKKVVTNQKHKKILKCLRNKEYWNPNITKISKDTGIPISTIFDNIKQINKIKNENEM